MEGSPRPTRSEQSPDSSPRMTRSPRLRRALLASSAFAALAAPPVFLYIGPGAGFAAAGSALVLVGTFLLAFVVILIWPFKAVYRLVTFPKRRHSKAKLLLVVRPDCF